MRNFWGKPKSYLRSEEAAPVMLGMKAPTKLKQHGPISEHQWYAADVVTLFFGQLINNLGVAIPKQHDIRRGPDSRQLIDFWGGPDSRGETAWRLVASPGGHLMGHDWRLFQNFDVRGGPYHKHLVVKC